MKKTITFLFAAIFATLTASAITPEVSTGNYYFKELKATQTNTPSKAPAANIDELTGEYNCYCYDYTKEDTPRITFSIDVRQGASENEVLINGIAGIPLDLVGTVEFTDDGGVITVPNQYLQGGQHNGCDVYFQHGAWVEDENGNQFSGNTDKPLNVLIADGGILFGYPNDIIQLLGHQNGESVERFCAVSNIIASKVYVDPFTYTPLEGKATFYDGWILPGFGFNQMDYPVEVSVERCVENPSQYRIVDPYSDPMFSELNEGTKDPGYIVFDAGNLFCVLALPGYKSGFCETKLLGLGNYYFFNLEGWLYDDYQRMGQDVSAEEIKNLLMSRGFETSKLAGNVLTFKNCLFGYDQNPWAGGNWNVGGEAVEMTSTLILPKDFNSVTGIEIDHKLDTEYFNLQGMKIENPQNGIFIRRQGNKTEKIFVR